MSARPPPKNVPLIPENYIDIPSQRLYLISMGGLCQAIKLFDLIRSITVNDQSFCKKWLLVDLLFCIALSFLHIPRLNYSKSITLLQIVILWFFDGLLFGGIQVHMGGPSSLISFMPLSVLLPFNIGLFGASESSTADTHLLGQHTIRMSPISTARFYPDTQSLCLSPPENVVLIPILLNNTTPSHIRYSLTPLGDAKPAEIFEISSKEIRSIEQARVDKIRLERRKRYSETSDDDDDFDEEDEDIADYPDLQASQTVVHIRVSKPGNVRLERVMDSSDVEARLVRQEMVIAPCPRIKFVDDYESTHCYGQDADVNMKLHITGVPPLTMGWYKSINGKKERLSVKGIEAEHRDGEEIGRERGIPQHITVNLTATLGVIGTHIFGIEDIEDSVGNLILLDLNSSDTSFTRTYNVLKPPSVSFKRCRPGNPAYILIGDETSLSIFTHESDPLDYPLDVLLQYLPPADTADPQRFQPWEKPFTISSKGGLSITAGAPGDYIITDVKGKFCSGEIREPDSCKVIERPLPSAEIEWKKIHECSGDTGVSATLSLRGSHPFTVFYTMRRDKEAPREVSKIFPMSRGELTIQPESSGHYTFKFLRISDAYYKNVPLDGPSIDQIVHPLATAEFVRSADGRTKRAISNCEGNSVKVDIDLRGTGPFTLEVQTVSSKSSNVQKFPGIEKSRKTLEIAIPSEIDRVGGSFEIDIVSVEDKYGCKRSLSVAGVSVNVRRIKPTAKFYSKEGERRVAVVEGQTANLPLRLTGDGPWSLRYIRREVPTQVVTARLTTPNDGLIVTDKGTYELLDIRDSLCPGSIVLESSTYIVDWVSRPHARLSSRTHSTYEPYNNSYILNPICETTLAHVDLDLEGREPFQIMYNVAIGNGNGGTTLIDQPTVNSIQRHTRFQLETSQAGRIFYEVKQIGDSAYPLEQHKNAVIPRSERLLFEQQVFMRPSAYFKTRGTLSYCANDAFTSTDYFSNDGVILFEGLAPFRLTLSIKLLGGSKAEERIIVVSGYSWKIDIPEFHFTSEGSYKVTIENVADASACAQAVLDPLMSSISVDVAKQAGITSVEKREHYCVGDKARFELEGIPPWTIQYDVNGKSQTSYAEKALYSIDLKRPGEYAITSIAHQQKKCRASGGHLQWSVHSLPSAQVGHGKRVYEDIHEGDQAEIVFTLIGTPPFTFTYQRSEPAPRKGGKAGKVLETHTVSRIDAHEYSVFSALEGTWTVTSISDKFCRYPVTQPEASG